MSTWLGIVCIVGIVLIAHVCTEWLKTRPKTSEISEGMEETLSKMDALEERIRVLERIVTENKFDLRQEINKL